MAKIVHMISDLHLTEDQPHLLKLFTHYMQTIAPQSNALFVLGDLFEVWVGDDHHNAFNQSIIDQFAEYSTNGGELYFGHGNRDFLLGDDYAKSCGGQILDEPYSFDWQDKSITLMHGDSLCTDDTAYQQLRMMVRNPQWQNEFLSQSVEQRLAFAASIREQSKSALQQKAEEIMDVNQQAVEQSFKDHQCDWLIHGHTHRPDIHEVNYDGAKGQRIVLSDWREQGQYLELKDGNFQNHYFSS